ncbi:MAG: UDP-N-acetylmuramoyl-L-alanyl-D-glutamate--2,6-diaminopimelate ligase [Candidatus Ancillula sp.]|jgi:UDP-N-acetylmuramoyl-L-alanyl-D-glutamate--2,6-diaminopimelate ligase|nr:UDP-N-acetylmuramoyl-L-alanyl-D-glutamate--2,6-diaminopimelate ligase [Candidatus Ancillula sp.]
MRLSELESDDIGLIGTDTEFYGISTNSRTVKPGDLFLCIEGVSANRHDFLNEAVEKGAVAAVVSENVSTTVPTLKVENVNDVADALFQKFYGNPQNELKLFGVTGTDGKTSISTILSQLIGTKKCANIGTNGIFLGEKYYPSWNTTPDSDVIYERFRGFLHDGATAVSMEFSSEAQLFGRLRNLKFDVLGLSNITREHLNAHGTLENYIQAKIDIFKTHLRPTGVAVLNADDQCFDTVRAQLDADGIKTLTYGRGAANDLQIKKYAILMNKTTITFVAEEQGRVNEYAVDSPLLGDFNVENLACALLMLHAAGFEYSQTLRRVPELNISGRLDVIDEGQDFGVIVDYAHTPNGLTRMFEFVKQIPNVNRIITVIGQAGERDKLKRPQVGEIVMRYSDLAVFTEEDPKNEPPERAVNDIVSTLVSADRGRYSIVLDRAEAIRYGVKMAQTGDLVLVLGKGNEDFHKVGDIKLPWSDEEVVRTALRVGD